MRDAAAGTLEAKERSLAATVPGAPKIGTGAPATSTLAAWTEHLVEGAAEAADRARLRALLASSRTAPGGDARVPYRVVVEVWDRLAAASGDPAFGLRAAERMEADALGVLGYLARTAETLGEALDRVQRYHRLLKDPSELSITATAAGLRVVERPPPGEGPYPRHLAEAILAAYVVLGRRWTGAPIAAVAASFEHARPEGTRAHVEVLGCEPVFGAAENALVLPVEAARLPLQTADAALGRYLEPAAAAALAALPAGDTLLADLSRVLLGELPDGYPSIDRVARRLGLSSRSLQRRLQERATRYQDVVDTVRHEAAVRLLSDSSLSVEEVAFLLGFSDPSGFHRAFRRWTGRAPRRCGTAA
jgi:AraC-like DNA-binding protein